MDFSKLKNKFLICLCCIVIILPFYLITFTYATEDGENVYFTSISGRLISGNSFTIAENANHTLYYLELEKGYTYYIHLNYANFSRTGYSNSIDVGSEIYNYTFYNTAGELDVVINGDTVDYLFYDYSTEYSDPVYTITRVKNSSMSSSVYELVDNVGINSIWNIFDISVNYIVVVVLFAFGCYIIFRIIKKVSRGKEGL